MTRGRVECKWLAADLPFFRNLESTMSPSFTISDLRQRPEFFERVAERIWLAWWKTDDHPLGYISGRLRENLSIWPLRAAAARGAL
jgi:hypothetical protein